MNYLIAITLLIIGLVVIDIDRKITFFIDILHEINIILGEEDGSREEEL